jgi:hypothetical protein
MTDGIAVRPLFTMTLDVTEPPQVVGEVPDGHLRRIIPIAGGRFAGKRLNGRILPGGAAWAAVRPSGVVNLEVRIVLETEEGERVYARYAGRRGGPPDIVARFTRGEPIPDGSDYFRVAMTFETAAPRLLWLNDMLAIGVGRRPPSGPCYEVYEIL